MKASRTLSPGLLTCGLGEPGSGSAALTCRFWSWFWFLLHAVIQYPVVDSSHRIRPSTPRWETKDPAISKTQMQHLAGTESQFSCFLCPRRIELWTVKCNYFPSYKRSTFIINAVSNHQVWEKDEDIPVTTSCNIVLAGKQNCLC